MRHFGLLLQLRTVCSSWRAVLPSAQAADLRFVSGTLDAYGYTPAPELWSRLTRAQPCAGFAAKSRKGSPAAKDSATVIDISSTLADTAKQMQATLDRLDKVLSGIRTGRASTGLLDNLPVLAYGERLSLQSLGSVSVQDAQTLIVTPFDPQTTPAITKAISDSPLNLSPRNAKTEIVVPVPKPSNETLQAMTKLVKQEAESARVAVRRARQGAAAQAKALPSEDDARRAEAEVQKLTDQFVKDIASRVSEKEAALSKL